MFHAAVSALAAYGAYAAIKLVPKLRIPLWILVGLYTIDAIKSILIVLGGF